MPTYEVGPKPSQISSEVIALLEQVETATIGHWRQWGFCHRGIQPLLRGKRVAGTAVTVAIPSLDSYHCQSFGGASSRIVLAGCPATTCSGATS